MTETRIEGCIVDDALSAYGAHWRTAREMGTQVLIRCGIEGCESTELIISDGEITLDSFEGTVDNCLQRTERDVTNGAE